MGFFDDLVAPLKAPIDAVKDLFGPHTVVGTGPAPPPPPAPPSAPPPAPAPDHGQIADEVARVVAAQHAAAAHVVAPHTVIPHSIGDAFGGHLGSFSDIASAQAHAAAAAAAAAGVGVGAAAAAPVVPPPVPTPPPPPAPAPAPATHTPASDGHIDVDVDFGGGATGGGYHVHLGGLDEQSAEDLLDHLAGKDAAAGAGHTSPTDFGHGAGASGAQMQHAATVDPAQAHMVDLQHHAPDLTHLMAVHEPAPVDDLADDHQGLLAHDGLADLHHDPMQGIAAQEPGHEIHGLIT